MSDRVNLPTEKNQTAIGSEARLKNRVLIKLWILKSINKHTK